MTRLNQKSLSKLKPGIAIPEYDRSTIKCGIAHIGVGNFHRSHEARYTDQLLSTGSMDWGICGICLLDRDIDMYNTLVEQDGLYTLLEKERNGRMLPRVIGSIVKYMFAPADPGAVISLLADPDVKIISLTITEGGYNFDASSGEFRISDPAIQQDLQHPERPVTVFGYLAAALRKRMEQGYPGLTLLSCDNLQHNGDICKKMLLSYLGEASPDLARWTEQELGFPNCMVDRITPRTTGRDINTLKEKFGIEDAAPVVCEPFIQWVIEDQFPRGRPDWEDAGVQFVPRVDPYEKMKIRLLNAGHSLLGFTGTLCGYDTIDQTMQDEMLRSLLRAFMDNEVSPVLEKAEGIDLETYKDSLEERFSNPFMGDQLARICSESSSKMPKFLLPTIREQIGRDGSIDCSALVVAAWCRYLELSGSQGHNQEIRDEMSDELLKAALASRHEDPLAFLKLEAVFGQLAQSGHFIEVYLPLIDSIRTRGIEDTIKRLPGGG